MSKFFNRLVQTGFLPQNIGADKGTSCHRRRQFMTTFTAIFDSDKVLEVVYIGQPVVKSHTDAGVAASIKEGLDTLWTN